MLQNKGAEIDFFDNFGQEKDYDTFDKRGYSRIVSEYLKYLNPSRKNKERLKVVDLGCGTGAFTSKFIDYNVDLCGIDLSQNCINYAKTKYPEIFFEVGDIENTSFKDNSVDVVFLSGVLHHFPDFSKVAKECYRILKVGGIVLAYDPNKSNPFMWTLRCKDSPFYSPKGVTVNERPLNRQEINDVFVSAHFSDTKVYSISGVTYKYLDNKLSFMILPAYNVIERLIDVTPLREKIGSFLITYSKK